MLQVDNAQHNEMMTQPNPHQMVLLYYFNWQITNAKTDKAKISVLFFDIPAICRLTAELRTPPTQLHATTSQNI